MILVNSGNLGSWTGYRLAFIFYINKLVNEQEENVLNFLYKRMNIFIFNEITGVLVSNFNEAN